MSDQSTSGESLSNRESEVAAAYVEGQSYKEIARSLSISPTTVRTHLRTVYRKLGVTSKIELIRVLKENSEVATASGRDEAALVAELALELDEAIRRERILGKVLRIISHQGDQLDLVIREVLNHALEICEAEFGILFEYHGDLRFEAMQSHNISNEFGQWLQEQGVFPVDAGTGLGRVASGLTAVNITDVRGEGIYRQNSPLRIATADLGNARSFAAIPMMNGNQLIGAFTVYRTRVHPFNERSLELAQLFADQAAIAIKNARSRTRHSDQGAATQKHSQAVSEPKGSSGNPPQKLAVLPFRVVDDSDDELIRTGARLSASIIMELSSSPLYRLIDQASCFSDSLVGSTLQEAAQKLDANLVVSGTIRRIGSDGIRVAGSLYQRDAPSPLWAEHFDSRGDDLNELIESLLTRLCAVIGTGIERQLVNEAQSRRSSNQTAMDYFLQGLELHHQHSADGFPKARKFFQQALEKDQEFGRAAAALAITYVRQWFWESDQMELLDIAEQHARVAIGLSPHDAWAQTVWGVVALYRHRHMDAELSFARAIELAPYDTYVVSRCGLGKLYHGQFDEAKALFQRAIDLDPLHADRNRGFLGHTLLHMEQYDEAINHLKAINQPLSWELAWLAACFAHKKDSQNITAVVAKFRTSFVNTNQRYEVQTRPFRRDSDRQKLFDSLRLAGISEDFVPD